MDMSVNPGLAKFSNQGIFLGFGGVFWDIHTQMTPCESLTSYGLRQADLGILALAGS